MHFLEICRNAFLLPLVSFFLTVLKLSRPRIHTSEWVQHSTIGLFFLCESRCGFLLVLILFSGNSFLLELFLMQFQCSCVHHLVLNLNLFLCLSLFTLINMLVCGCSLLPLTTVTFVLLLFHSNPFFLLSSSTMSNNCCKSSLFSGINTVSSACLKLFKLSPPTLIPGFPSRFCIIISL